MRYESKEERDKDVCCQHASLAYTQRPSLDTYGTVSSILLLNTDFGCRATEPGFAWDIGIIEV